MTPDDLARVHARCFTTPAPWTASGFADLLASPFVFLEHRAEGQAFVLGRVIADEAELLTIATLPEVRHQGHGRALMLAFEATARARGATTAFLEVAETNTAAQMLYKATGFTQQGRRKGYYVAPEGARIDALLLCKALPPN